jgi:hypothetical protein
MLHAPGTSSVANLLALAVLRACVVSNDQKRSKSRVLVPVSRSRRITLKNRRHSLDVTSAVEVTVLP